MSETMGTFLIQIITVYPPTRPDTRSLSSKGRGEGDREEKKEAGEKGGRGDVGVWEGCA